jgi:hypothetical protein
MRFRFLFLVLSLLVLTPPANAKKKDFPQEIVKASSVTIMFLSASGPAGNAFTPGLSSQDRAALTDVETAFRKWRRYSVLLDPRQADLIIAVRTGQQTVKAGVGVGKQGGTKTTQADYGLDIGPTADMIQVYSGNVDFSGYGGAGPVLWTGAECHGLAAPDLPLLERFKKEVEQAAQGKK